MSRDNLEDKNSTRKVKCDVCNQTLAPELTLSEHKIIRHPMAKDVRAMRPAILKRSRLDTNNKNGGNNLNHQCIRCSYSSNNSSNLGRHLEVRYYKVLRKWILTFLLIWLVILENYLRFALVHFRRCDLTIFSVVENGQKRRTSFMDGPWTIS